MCRTVPSSLSLWSDCSRSAAPENGRCAWSDAAAAKKTVAATDVVERERSILFYILRCRGRGRRRIQTYPALADPPVVQMHDRDAPAFHGTSRVRVDSTYREARRHLIPLTEVFVDDELELVQVHSIRQPVFLKPFANEFLVVPAQPEIG